MKRLFALLFLVLASTSFAQTDAQGRVAHNEMACDLLSVQGVCTDAKALTNFCAASPVPATCESADLRTFIHRVYAIDAVYTAALKADNLATEVGNRNFAKVNKALQLISAAYRLGNQTARDGVCTALGLPATVCQ